MLRSLRISGKMFQAVDKINSQYSGLQKFILLILFPLFDVKDISHYKESSLYQLYKCGKDVFYRFTGNADFSWRRLSCHVNLRLLKRVEKSSYNNENRPVRCLIADDTDLPKRGRCFEHLSRIWMGRRGSWHGLLTTNTKLTFEKTFEIYATRWTIEVFFMECKQYLRLGK